MNGALLILILLKPTPDAGHPYSKRADSGFVTPSPSADDEVVKNLELLEHLDETADLELLQELTPER